MSIFSWIFKKQPNENGLSSADNWASAANFSDAQEQAADYRRERNLLLESEILQGNLSNPNQDKPPHLIELDSRIVQARETWDEARRIVNELPQDHPNRKNSY